MWCVLQEPKRMFIKLRKGHEMETDDVLLKKNKVPYWYDESLKPCKCVITEPKIIMEDTSWSDFGYFKYKCPKCGQEWCWYIEG